MCRGKVTELKASAEKNELMPRLKTWLQRLWSLGFIGDRSIMKYWIYFVHMYVRPSSFPVRTTSLAGVFIRGHRAPTFFLDVVPAIEVALYDLLLHPLTLTLTSCAFCSSSNELFVSGYLHGQFRSRCGRGSISRGRRFWFAINRGKSARHRYARSYCFIAEEVHGTLTSLSE